MVHQPFDAVVDLFLLRQDHARIVQKHRSHGHLREGLLDDPHALVNLQHAADKAVVVVSPGPERDFEIELAVNQIGLGLAHVVGDSGGAQDGPGEPIGQRQLPRDRSGAGHAVDKDPVAREKPIAVRDQPSGFPKRLRDLLAEVLGKIVLDAADAGIRNRQPRPGHRLDDPYKKLARLDQIEAYGDGSELRGGHAAAGQMVGNTRQLAHDDPDELTARRGLHSQKLLHRQRVADVVDQGRDIVETVRVGDHLRPGRLLAHLGEAAVQEAHRHVAREDLLSLQFEIELDSPVGRRMGGAHLQVHGLYRKLFEVSFHSRRGRGISAWPSISAATAKAYCRTFDRRMSPPTPAPPPAAGAG